MRRSIIAYVLAFMGSILTGVAQNDQCSNALNLCPNVTYSASNINATADVCAGCADAANAAGNFCFEIDNTVWFTFTTNAVGGNADVTISNLL